MSTIENQKQKMTRAEIKLAFLASLVYFVNYLARYDFAASVLSMTSTFGRKDILGIALTVSSITYGAGQIITGILGDRIPPKYAVFAGLTGTGICNLIVGLTKTPGALVVIWGCNGIMQAMIWPSLVRQMANDLSPYAYKQAIICSSVASSLSSVLVYLAVVPLSITIGSWRIAFFFASVCAVLSAFGWFLSVKPIKAERPELSHDLQAEDDEDDWEHPQGKRQSGVDLMLLAGVPLIYVMIACHGLLREGIGDWMPSLMSDTFHLEEIASVMSSSIIPLFATGAVFVASKLFDILQNEMKTCLVLWGVGAGVSVLLFFFIGFSPVVAVALMAVLATSIHGVNHIATTRLQTHFKKAGLVSTATGLLNSATYVGAAVSGYGIAVFSENFGWKYTVLLWAGVAALGIVFTILVYRRWTRFAETHD